MSTKPTDAMDELERIADGVTETLFEMSDDEILEQARAAGRDSEESAGRVRGVLLDAVAQHHRGREPSREHSGEDATPTGGFQMPPTAAARLDLLLRVTRAGPTLSGALTIQHRDLRSLPDEDVISLLRQLAELGALDDL